MSTIFVVYNWKRRFQLIDIECLHKYKDIFITGLYHRRTNPLQLFRKRKRPQDLSLQRHQDENVSFK